ncbi:molybdopterin molybdotransferase MoeA [Picrophilus oshimae]|uniref:Putative molybdopterin biosynthesis protein n=1 Tax=Picrophilus torridus (strain ATCC 700027 / DSM 9790 / JCM 10055 / NBRC 100828 / KAW 2/3) TaxID=1122961 RepID=A0A8G2FX05_PICTO|nr:molybdopterin molybdotransferase MoeA [Picrophilus oshimae]SMD31054.1 putative molybdopterin biosynthesis protein [Picrophilus oshimae DSM 9789]
MGMIFHSLIDINEASLKLNNIRKIDDVEVININDAIGRISAEDVFSRMPLPLYSRSQVDGYAVLHDDLLNADYNKPVRLKLAGETYIGEKAVKHPGHGYCIKVPTGGIIPIGADAMVPFEDTENESDYIKFIKPVEIFNEISNAGVDLISGELIINKYKMIDERDIAVLASTGQSRLKVLRRLSIGIIPTGDELINPGDDYIPGKIYDSSASMYSELKKYPAFSVIKYNIAKDSYDEISNAIHRSVNENDVTVTIGSTSAGDRDMVYKILENISPGIIFHGLRVKPGKPMAAGINKDKLILAMPGFPVSSMMLLYSLVIPALFNMLHYNYKICTVNGITGSTFRLHRGYTDLMLVRAVKRDNLYVFYPVPGDSGSITRIKRANGFSIIRSENDYLKKGSSLEAHLFNNDVPEILFYGQYYPYLNINLNYAFVEAGYNNIIESMKNHEADVYISNYSDIDHQDYYSIKKSVEYGLCKNSDKRDIIAVLYNGSGLYERSKPLLKNFRSVLYMENPYTVSYYVNEKRCDAGITYKIYSDLYKMPFESLGFIDFNFYISRNSKYFKVIYNEIEKL